MYVFKLLNGQLPYWLLNLPQVSEYNNLITRQQNNLIVPPTRTMMGERKLSVRGPRLWNDLPQTVKSTVSINTLKKNLKRHFMQNQN